MKLKLWHRLFVASALSVLLGVALMLGFQQLTFRSGLHDYLNERDREQAALAVDVLAGEYRQFGWRRIQQQPQLLQTLIDPDGWRGLPRRPPPRRPERAAQTNLPSDTEGGERPGAGMRERPDGRGPTGRPPRPPPPAGAPPMRYALLSADGSPVAGPNRPRESLQLPIIVDGERVGQLLQYPKPKLEDDLAQAFSRAQWTNGMFSALGIVLLLLPASWWYARRLATPLSRMADRARQISAGDYAGRVALHSKDEIGELAADFDAMAAALDQNRQARQRWTAEISHELRTPLAVMRAEIEAIEDGLRPLDSRALQSLGSEVQRLGGLVDDLYQLARADAGSLDYRMQRCDLVALIHQAIASHAAGLALAGLHLTQQLPERAELWADPDRLLQLIGNLLTNSLRYTDTGGRLHVSLSPADQAWDWRFEDSAPAVAAEALPQLFEPLFRADPSRSRQHGGAGLGLAIVQRIALAHGASVSAELSPLGGLCIRLRWPLR